MFQRTADIVGDCAPFPCSGGGFSAANIFIVAAYLGVIYWETSCSAYCVVMMQLRCGAEIPRFFISVSVFWGGRAARGCGFTARSYKKVKVCDTIDIRNRRAQEPRSAAAMSPHRKKRAVFPVKKTYLPFGNAGAKTFCFRRYFAKTALLCAVGRPPIAPIVAPNSFRRFRFFIYGVQKQDNRRRKYCFYKRGAV